MKKVFLFLSIFTFSCSVNQSNITSKTESLVFNRFDNIEHKTNIYFSNIDGTNQNIFKLSEEKFISDSISTISKNTNEIFFISDKDKMKAKYGNPSNTSEIYKMDYDKKNLKRITNNFYEDYSPSYSNLTKKTFFVSNRTSNDIGKSDIYSIDENGKEELIVENASNPIALNKSGKIIYSSASPELELYLFELTTKNKTKLNKKGIATDISLDDNKILFLSNDIYELNLETMKETKLTNSKNSNQEIQRPIWSSDMKSIYFDLLEKEQTSIYKINSDGSNQIKLMDNASSPKIVSK